MDVLLVLLYTIVPSLLIGNSTVGVNLIFTGLDPGSYNITLMITSFDNTTTYYVENMSLNVYDYVDYKSVTILRNVSLYDGDYYVKVIVSNGSSTVTDSQILKVRTFTVEYSKINYVDNTYRYDALVRSYVNGTHLLFFRIFYSNKTFLSQEIYFNGSEGESVISVPIKNIGQKGFYHYELYYLINDRVFIIDKGVFYYSVIPPIEKQSNYVFIFLNVVGLISFTLIVLMFLNVIKERKYI